MIYYLPRDFCISGTERYKSIARVVFWVFTVFYIQCHAACYTASEPGRKQPSKYFQQQKLKKVFRRTLLVFRCAFYR